MRITVELNEMMFNNLYLQGVSLTNRGGVNFYIQGKEFKAYLTTHEVSSKNLWFPDHKLVFETVTEIEAKSEEEVAAEKAVEKAEEALKAAKEVLNKVKEK